MKEFRLLGVAVAATFHREVDHPVTFKERTGSQERLFQTAQLCNDTSSTVPGRSTQLHGLGHVHVYGPRVQHSTRKLCEIRLK